MADSLELKTETVLHRLELSRYQRGPNGDVVLIDPEGPNWIGTDARGAEILELFDSSKTFGAIVSEYSTRHELDLSRAWLHVHTFTRDALRHGLLAGAPFERAPYEGRSAYLTLESLKELWIHTNNSCNLSCTHCLVDSSPSGEEGLPTETILRTVDEAHGLGVTQFYFTGGEPFLRQDFFELVERVLGHEDTSLTILTNGTVLDDRKIAGLKRFPASRLHLQISLDGSRPEINDPIRGEGTFAKIIEGVKRVVESGISPTVSTVITPDNVEDVGRITRLLSSMGVRNHHLLFMHHRGRAVGHDESFCRPVPAQKLIDAVRDARRVALESGMTIDNLSFVRMRVDSPIHTRYDLSNACWDSLCMYSDGEVYPSAALAGHRGLSCGNVKQSSLQGIWRDSPVCRRFRQATLQNKPGCRECDLRFLCGGGDMEHAYLYSAAHNGGDGLSSMDPYCGLHKALIIETMHELTGAGAINNKSGAPVVFRGMGEDAARCGAGACDGSNNNDEKGFVVRTLSSNCVLSAVHEGPRRAVREFYSRAATDPQEELCCTTGLSDDDVSHIPEGVLERAYGCGGPVNAASITGGERVLDLGSGAGIDCFIAAKRVGPTGRVIGVDMTDEMLDAAGGFRQEVAGNLGYDVVEFRKGFLEEIPVESASVDVILSNCVINLSPDKRRVFREMWRVLADHGRIVISDIVSSRKVPERLRADKQLWGQCLSGALTEEEFLCFLEQAGFYGIRVLSKTFWKEVEGHRFFSVTVRGYKYEKRAECAYQGHRAVYLGPHKAIIDEEGHLFPRGEEVEVCTDTARKLREPPYDGSFAIIDPSGDTDAGIKCEVDSDSDSKCCG